MKLTPILAAAFAAFTTLSTDAALITWGAAQNITGDTDVSTTGTLVGAASSLGSTVNGVTFTGGLSGGTVGIFTPGDFAGTGGVGADPALSPAYLELLRGGLGIASGQPATLTISGLDVGATYDFQWWSNGRLFHDAGELTSAGGPSLDQNTTDNSTSGRGQFQIGTFIADNAIQVITFTATGTNGPSIVDGVFNAAQLRQTAAAPPVSGVPEPGTALAGLVLVGLCGTMRRRR